MGRVSKRFLDKTFEKELEDQLTFIVSSLTDKNEVTLFLTEFLTREEKIMLGKRLVLYMLLSKGLSNVEINRVLGMSFETIRWYKAIFVHKPELFKKNVGKLISREKSQEFWQKIEKILEPFELAMKAKTDMKARARLANADFWKP